jgi:hypothetical protein
MTSDNRPLRSGTTTRTDNLILTAYWRSHARFELAHMIAILEKSINTIIRLIW